LRNDWSSQSRSDKGGKVRGEEGKERRARNVRKKVRRKIGKKDGKNRHEGHKVEKAEENVGREVGNERWGKGKAGRKGWKGR
jgi:hypothetical protein